MRLIGRRFVYFNAALRHFYVKILPSSQSGSQKTVRLQLQNLCVCSFVVFVVRLTFTYVTSVMLLDLNYVS